MLRKYCYWDAQRKCLDFEGLIEDLENAPPRAVEIVLNFGDKALPETHIRLAKVISKQISSVRTARHLLGIL